MDQTDDRELLREFVSRRCGAAFARLVRRHVDLVYSAARRQMKDPAIAEDVTQEVFVTLATKAKSIRDGEALAGWLLVTTRFVALNQLRSNERRRRHEHEAAVMQLETRSDHEGEPPLWQSIGPMLDEAIAALKREDRDAVVMRYFQGRSVAEVAAALGVSQEAAQKRVSRAVERLRGIFASRGIAASEQGLTSILTANAIAAAPAMLAAKIASVAFAKATLASATSSMAIGKGTATTLMAAKAKIIAASVAGVLLVGITGTIAYQQVIGAGAKSREVSLAPATAEKPLNATLVDQNAPRGPTYTTAPAVSWMQEFHRVYDLADGEIVKFVPQPFIADRLKYYEAYLDPQQVKSAPRGPDVFVFEYSDPHTLKWRGAMYSGGSAGDIGYALGAVADLERCHMIVPRNILALPMAGDWVYRAGSTPEQRIEAISKLIADKLKQPNGKLVSKPMERDAIVVSGSFDYHPLPASQKDSQGTGTSGPNPIYLFTGQKSGASHGGGTCSVASLLDYLGSSCGRPIALETKVPGDTLVSWQDCLYFSTVHATGGMNDADVDSVLANVAKQTSLQFKRDKRTLPTWVWEKGG